MAIIGRELTLPDNKTFAPTQVAPDETAPFQPITFMNVGVPQRIEPKNVVAFYVAYPQKLQNSSYLVEAVVNPTSFTESMSSEYSKRPVIGLSHEVLQYSRTSNREIKMELWVSYTVLIQRFSAQEKISPLQYRNRFHAMLVPAGPRMCPPVVVLYWPFADLGFKGVATSIEIEYTQFSQMGDPLEYTITAAFTEIPDRLIQSPYVKTKGIGYASLSSHEKIIAAMRGGKR